MYKLREGITLLIRIMLCCAAGTFKGFAMLRQLTGASQHLLGLANPVYVKGHGFLPAGQGPMMGHPVQSVGQHRGASAAFGTSTLSSGDLSFYTNRALTQHLPAPVLKQCVLPQRGA